MRASRHPCLVLLLLAVVLPSVVPAQSVMQITTVPLRPGIWVLSGFANGNILVHDDGTDVLLVDAQSERRVGLADSALRALTTRPVTTRGDDPLSRRSHRRQSALAGAGRATHRAVQRGGAGQEGHDHHRVARVASHAGTRRRAPDRVLATIR